MTSAATAIRTQDGRPRGAVFGALVLVGMLLIALSWVTASGELRYEDQLAAVNVGVVGTVVVLGSCALYLVLYRRSVRGRTSALRPHTAEVGPLG